MFFIKQQKILYKEGRVQCMKIYKLFYLCNFKRMRLIILKINYKKKKVLGFRYYQKKKATIARLYKGIKN